MIVDELIKHYQGVSPFSIKKTFTRYESEVVSIKVATKDGTKNLFLIKPLTFMNHSGNAVLKFMQNYKFPKTEMLVVYDDVYIPFGKLRFKVQNSSGGHNGLGSIINRVGSGITCLKGGIASEVGAVGGVGGVVLEKYVLENFSGAQKTQLKSYLAFSVKAIVSFLENGLEKTRQNFNNKSWCLGS